MWNRRYYRQGKGVEVTRQDVERRSAQSRLDDRWSVGGETASVRMREALQRRD